MGCQYKAVNTVSEFMACLLRQVRYMLIIYGKVQNRCRQRNANYVSRLNSGILIVVFLGQLIFQLRNLVKCGWVESLTHRAGRASSTN